MPKTPSLGEYLLQQLWKRGVRHIFGVPGDYVLRFYDLIEHSPIRHVGTTREDAAGFAADAYARVQRSGSRLRDVLRGRVEPGQFDRRGVRREIARGRDQRVPGLKERQRNPLLHHRVRDFSTQREVFERLTVASTALEDPLTAYHEIDRVLSRRRTVQAAGVHGTAAGHGRRGPPASPAGRCPQAEQPDEAALAECLAEAVHC